MQRTDGWRNGVQINTARVVSPKDSEGLRHLLTHIRERSPNDFTVLQLHPELLNNTGFMADLAWDYAGLVSYVLLDPSMGRGAPYDLEETRDLVGKIKADQPAFDVAVAGGLSGQNVERLFGPLLEDFPDLSCDAQGGLRKEVGGISLIDMGAVRDYIAATARVIRTRRTSY